MSIFHKYKYFSSFVAGNCARNSGFKRMNDTVETIQQRQG